MIQLYWAPRTRSLRALWILEEAGVPYERIRLDLSSGDQKRADFRAINPMAKVPALTDGPVAVAESGAICAYVAEACPEARLAPPMGDSARGRYLQWLFFRRDVSSKRLWRRLTRFRLGLRRQDLVTMTASSTCSRRLSPAVRFCLANGFRRPMS